MIFSSWWHAAWALLQLAVIAVITFANAGLREPVETVVLSVFCGWLALIWVGGVAVLALRPQLARRPTRPHTPGARACLVAAGVIAVATYFGALLLSTRSLPGLLAMTAASIVLVIALTVTARRLNDRAEAAGRLPAPRPVDSYFAG